MRGLSGLTAPLLLGAAMLCALRRDADLYGAMVAGAGKGLRVCAEIFPSLVVLFPVIYLLRVSGLLSLVDRLLGPLLSALGIPPETGLLLLLRPLSGSAALGAAAELIAAHGPDTLVGRTAAVMLGSSETTFYVIAVYYGAAGVRDSRWAIPAALCADLSCFLCSAWVCRLLWG